MNQDYEIGKGNRWIKCHICGMTSHNPGDVKNRYCGNCCLYLDDAMVFEVEMRMYQKGVIRNVGVPIGTLTDHLNRNLEVIFARAQNDYQPSPGHVSASMGDVIRYHGDRYLILGVGFKKLEEGEATEQLTDPDKIAEEAFRLIDVKGAT